MIRLLKNSDIDLVKYDQCVTESSQCIVYALSWYLNCTSDDWSCLVYEDYQAVMPISYLKTKRNLYLKKVHQPTYSQQLGIFSRSSLSQAELGDFAMKFLDLSPKSYSFNSGNTALLDLENFKLSERTNYELKLDRPYSEIKENYSKNLSRNIKKALNGELKIQGELDIEAYIDLKKSAAEHLIKAVHFKVLRNLIIQAQSRGMAQIYGVYQSSQLIAAAVCLIAGGRVIHLSSVSNKDGKSLGATPFLFDFIIQDYASSPLIFDFEGSMLEGVARFFKSFGSENVPYFRYEQ